MTAAGIAPAAGPAASGRAGPETVEALGAVLERFVALKSSFDHRLEDYARGLGLSATRLLVVRDVVGHPGTGLGAVSRRCGLKTSAASKVVEGLVAEGFLERRRGDDRRALSLHPGPPFAEGRFCSRSAIEGVFPGWTAFVDPGRRIGLETALGLLEELLGTGGTEAARVKQAGALRTYSS